MRSVMETLPGPGGVTQVPIALSIYYTVKPLNNKHPKSDQMLYSDKTKHLQQQVNAPALFLTEGP